MRKQLKKISEQLSQQIKKKRFIPKKKVAEQSDDEVDDKNLANGKNYVTQLESGDSYKTVIVRQRCTREQLMH